MCSPVPVRDGTARHMRYRGSPIPPNYTIFGTVTDGMPKTPITVESLTVG